MEVGTILDHSQRFLVELSDGLLKTSAAREIMHVAVERLGRKLSAQRVGYGEASPHGRSVFFDTCFAEGAAPLVGTFELDSFGAKSIEKQRLGLTQSCDDVLSDPDQDPAVCASIDTRAFLSVPLVREGRFVASLYVNYREPRCWTADEVALIQEVAARTWAAVERARAKEALRESEERLRLATEYAEIGFWDVDVVNDVLIWPPRVKAMFGISPDVPVTMADFYAGLHPDDRAATSDAFAASADPGRRAVYDVEYRTVGKEDGIIRWVAAKGRGIFDGDRCLRVVGTAIDISARRRVEQRRLALVDLGNHIREIDDPAELAFQAGAILARTLNVDRAGYGTTDTASETIAIERDWNAPGVQTIAGTLRFRDYGSYIEDLVAGRTVAIADARQDPRTRDTAAALEAIHARSFVNMPVTERGGFVALLYLNHGQPRDWPEDELAFIREVAERTRTATARLEVQRELRLERDRLDEESKALEILNRTGAQVAAELDLDKLVQGVVDAGVELTRARFGAFFYNVVDDKGASYMLYALSGAERSAFDSFGMPRATKVFAPTFKGEGVIRSHDILTDERYGHNAPHKGMPEGHLPVRSYLAVPVMSRSGEVIGGLFFGHNEPGCFTERDERIMVGLAGQAAIGIDNARLFDAAQRANAELEDRVRQRTLQLEQAHEALRQSQKMEAVGQLTGGIAHDFDNMLAVVIGSLDLLGRRIGAEDARSRRYLDAAADGARRAANLTQRLLAFSRQQPLRPEPVNANRLVAGMSALLHHSLGGAVQLETVLAAGLWRTHADPNQLENVILNLAVNARDAMPGGGKVTIETQNAHLDDRYAVAHLGLQAGQYVLIAVTDTGTGMPEEVIAKAFDPFFTTKEVGKGTGLGLSQVYGFVKQTGGHVKIYSEPGQGTTVKVYLPRFIGEGADEGDDYHVRDGPAWREPGTRAGGRGRAVGAAI